MTATMQRDAILSEDGAYRYALSRWWGHGPRVAWVMLNPSTADATDDDPTIRRCIGFARAWGYDGIEVVNLFALRATDPRRIAEHTGPIGGTRQYAAITYALGLPRVVAAWGAGNPYPAAAAIGRIRHASETGRHVYCLGVTKDGSPRHPLYVRGDTPLIRWPVDHA